MDRVKLQNHLTDFFKKYRYPVIIVLLGVVLMCLPTGRGDSEPTTTVPLQADSTVSGGLEEALTSILSQIKGAGKVEVLLTEGKGAETVYQSDSTTGSDNTRFNTVTVTDRERTQSGLIRQIIPPTYLGAIVLCQGADSPAVRLAIVEAVRSVTGLGADHITVLKMK